MKTLEYYRHTDKENGEPLSLASAIGLKKTRLLFENKPFDVYFYGTIERTKQTAVAAMVSGKSKLAELCPIENIGKLEFFDALINEQTKNLVNSGETWIDAIYKTNQSQIILDYEKLFAEAVMDMFSEMSDGQIAIAFGHDPLISMAARYFGLKAPSLKTLEGILFTQDDYKKVTAQMIG